MVVGTNTLYSGGNRYGVEKIIVHKEYNSGLITNDISLIKVSEPIVFNNLVQPIDLPDKDTAEGADLLLTGWGRTSVSFDKQKIPMKKERK